MSRRSRYPFRTLPDYLAPGLDLLFVGINPGTYSVERGHYFARTTNRFWPAFSRSRLSTPIRRALGVKILTPEHDALLLRFGIGFTDVVKVPSRNAAELDAAAFAEWAPRLLARLRRYAPRVACFHGVTAYRGFLDMGGLEGPFSIEGEPWEGSPAPSPQPPDARRRPSGSRGAPRYRAARAAAQTFGLGLQPVRVGTTWLYVVPNPSPANAHFTIEDQRGWYDRLAAYLRISRAATRMRQ